MKFNLLAWGTVLFMQVQSGLPASSISPGETQRELPPAGLTQDPDNPLASARPGDEVSYSQKVRMGTETEQSRFHIKVLSVKKDLVSYQVTTTQKDGSESKDTRSTRVYPTLKEQLLNDLKRLGTVEVVQYQARRGSYRYKGNPVDVTLVEIDYHWTLNKEKIPWKATYSISKDLPFSGHYGMHVVSKTKPMEFSYDLDSHVRGRAGKEKEKSIAGSMYSVQSALGVGQYGQAREHLKEIDPKAATGWMAAHLPFYQAWLAAGEGKSEEALQALSRAVEAGFDDYFVFWQTKAFQPLGSNPRFRELLGKMRMSPADRFELFWLKQEIRHVHHETMLMIAENGRRTDTGRTVIPKQTVPLRLTKSPGVLSLRDYLVEVQLNQILTVMTSDSSRMSSQSIINMWTPPGSGMDHMAILNLRLRRESRELAQQNARLRRDAIAARKFRLPAGISTEPAPVPMPGDPKLGEQLKKLRELREMSGERSVSSSDNPFLNARRGDELTYYKTQSRDGSLEFSQSSKITFKVVDVRKDWISYEISESNEADKVSTRKFSVKVLPTLKEQLIHHLERIMGKLEVLRYQARKGSYNTSQHRSKVTWVEIEVSLGNNNEKSFWKAEFAVNKDLPALGYYGMTLTEKTSKGYIELQLDSRKFGHGKSCFDLAKKKGDTPPSAELARPPAHPLKNTTAGSSTLYEEVVTVAGQAPQKTRVKTTIVEKLEDRVSLREVRSMNGKEQKLPLTTKIIAPTLREQVVNDLEKMGPVKVRSFTARKGTYEFRGKPFPVDVVEMEFTWTLNKVDLEWTAVFQISPEVPGLGYFEFHLKSDNGQLEMRQVLKEFKKG